MVRAYGLFSQTLSQMKRHAFRQATRVHKDQRGAMLRCQFRDAVVDFVPHLVCSNGSELATGHLDGQVHLSPETYLRDLRVGTIGTRQEARHNSMGF